MKNILYVTGSRAEYGIMKRLLLQLDKEDDIKLTIIATGMHCDEKYGLTYKFIENDGLKIEKLINIDIDNSSNAGILKTMAKCQTEFGDYFESNKFDAIIILGDRYEILSVAIAAAIHNLPIIHLHGGEQTLGNYDEFIRHAITKMSNLHLVSTDEYRDRVIQMGEHPDLVHNIGALGAENVIKMTLPTIMELENKFGSLARPYFMVVFHPETLNEVSPITQTEELLGALDLLKACFDFIFIGSNSDTKADEIAIRLKKYCQQNKNRFIPSTEPEEYIALCKYSQGLIGNSSSGLIEIPSLKIPTINIGNRQKGRVRGNSVIDTDCKTYDIYHSILLSQTHDFKNKTSLSGNPYYRDNALSHALNIIKSFIINNKKDVKKFYDIKINADNESNV
ncbi:UDP-N-acetylglucosamine 2-epimerase (hydrolyzing) [Escherichia albertii]|nr:UDP-N-acetylglucosamine 2-epimerase (hydrolyzing) [Escherichia albertii]